MSTIGQVRRMLRIQALEAAKREDYRTRTRVQKSTSRIRLRGISL